MLREEAEALRDAAAAGTLRRIERDRRRASRPVAVLLDYIAAHLFDPGLRYGRMRVDCDIRDNNRSTVFRREVGLTPGAYVRDCRFEIACRLLRDSELEVARIGTLVGHEGADAFASAFRRWADMTPAAYRRAERRAAATMRRAASEAPDLSPAAWRRVVEGELETAEADLLLRFVLALYPGSRRHLLRELLRQVQVTAPDAVQPTVNLRVNSPASPPRSPLVPSLRTLFARDDVERLMAEAVWEELRDLPWSEQRDLVCHHQRFTTGALVELLGEKSRVEGRRDRGRGVAIARLALEAATAVEGLGGEGRGALQAQAWAWLGNAKRLALDFVGADQAFEAARRRLPRDRPEIEGDVLSMLATLRRWQRRYAESLELSRRAMPLLEADGDVARLAPALIQRGIVHRELGEIAAAIADNEAALRLLDPKRDRRLVFAARFNRARCLVEERSPLAPEAIRELGGIAATLADAAEARIAVEWLEGLLALAQEDAEEALRRLSSVRRSLLEQQRMERVAVVDLDLALAALCQGDRRAARAYVAEALPIFESLAAVGREVLVGAVLREDARQVVERLAAILDRGKLTTRALAALQRIAQRVFDAP